MSNIIKVDNLNEIKEGLAELRGKIDQQNQLLNPAQLTATSIRKTTEHGR